ncbi:hypothetical protein [Ralstonia sp. A12]|uniref:hypothetical protein n=1 Tax=Ralstonia sp. A12 TaxID=1217052 RepID=UPI0012ED8456|nr:hypothetical protein [Ralstonia sp. A12]
MAETVPISAKSQCDAIWLAIGVPVSACQFAETGTPCAEKTSRLAKIEVMMTRRTHFCVNLNAQAYPFLRQDASAVADDANPFLRKSERSGVPVSAA